MKRFATLLFCLMIFCSSALADTLTLPMSLTSIEAEAFMGDTSLDKIVMGANVRKIGARAFAGSSLKAIYLPASVESIADDAFPKNVKVTAPVGSYAYNWAVRMGYIEGDVLLTGIKLDRTDEKLSLGDTQTVKVASYTPENATDPSVTWISSDTRVATVTSKGEVTAVGAGTAMIIALANDGSGVSARYTLTVDSALVESLALSWNGIQVNEWTYYIRDVGDTLSMTATVKPDNAANKSITWTSSDPSVASVSASGVVTMVSRGTANITAKTNDGSDLSVSFTVQVQMKAVVGSTIRFGRYEQDGSTYNGAESIEWLVLKKDQDTATLISKFGLAKRRYSGSNVSFSDSEIRTWLNDTFLSSAFTAEEQAQLSTYWGNKVSLLSYSDASSCFSSDKDRYCYPTPAIKSWLSEVGTDPSGWYLMGGSSYGIDFVTYYGSLASNESLGSYSRMIRPVIVLKL